jgi:prepilin-type N-terminal cleavage/methylation domain-containing protein
VKNWKNEKGMTLVEVILTVLIFGIAFLAIMLGLRHGLLIRGESYERMIAGNLARQQLELLKRFVDTNNGRESGVWTTTVSPAPTAKGITYNVSTGVIQNANGVFATAAGIVPVRATVNWTSHGKANTVVLETCYAIPVLSAMPTSTPTPTPTPTPAAWRENIYYAVGSIVTYYGATYQCINAHTSWSWKWPDGSGTPSGNAHLWRRI